MTQLKKDGELQRKKVNEKKRRGCPLLENLTLEIMRRESEENYYFEIPTLKRLTLSILRSIETNNKIVLNVPNLEYLSIRQGWLHSLFVIKDLSSLIQAKASCLIKNDGFCGLRF